MSRHALRLLPALVTALVALLSLGALSTTATADQPDGFGPSHPFDDSIMPNDGPQPSVRHEAMIARTAHGYRLIAAEQNSRLRLKVVEGRLRFRDTRVSSWKSLPSSCRRLRVSPGVGASCSIPDGASVNNPVLLEVRPRLGNDHVDGRGLPAAFDMAVLSDAGHDVMFGGRGNDYLGGAQGNDRAIGGAGRDWIRGGGGRDRIWGGRHGDALLGLAGRDRISGGSGKNRIKQ